MMRPAEELIHKARKLILEGKIKGSCEPDPNIPGRYICRGIIPNDDGRTYREAALTIEVKKLPDGKVELITVPGPGEPEKQDLFAQIALKEYFKIFYELE